MLRTKLKFKLLCLDSLEQWFSEANQLPVPIPYDPEVKRVDISAQEMESSWCQGSDTWLWDSHCCPG